MDSGRGAPQQGRGVGGVGGGAGAGRTSAGEECHTARPPRAHRLDDTLQPAVHAHVTAGDRSRGPHGAGRAKYHPDQML